MEVPEVHAENYAKTCDFIEEVNRLLDEGNERVFIWMCGELVCAALKPEAPDA